MRPILRRSEPRTESARESRAVTGSLPAAREPTSSPPPRPAPVHCRARSKLWAWAEPPPAPAAQTARRALQVRSPGPLRVWIERPLAQVVRPVVPPAPPAAQRHLPVRTRRRASRSGAPLRARPRPNLKEARGLLASSGPGCRLAPHCGTGAYSRQSAAARRRRLRATGYPTPADRAKRIKI